MFRLIAKLYLWLTRWSIVNRPADLPKYILVVGPHTSNWDFVNGVFMRSVLQLDIRFLGKSQLFRPPFGWLFRAMGGYPLERSKSGNQVDAVVKIFNSKEKFRVAMAPEGTRAKVTKLKTGFYYIAKLAQIPIIMATIDYGPREVRFSEPFFPGVDPQKDIAFITNWFSQSKGKYPERGI
jgi:1-acyl-sn-glycerol-3-phosphate acyltransferase